MIEFDPANVPADTDFGIRITGDIMLPRYVPRQVVFIEQCKELYNGEIGVFVYDDNAYIKQYTESLGESCMIFFCDCCHYTFSVASLPDRCPDCGKQIHNEKPAVRAATTKEMAEYERIQQELMEETSEI